MQPPNREKNIDRSERVKAFKRHLKDESDNAEAREPLYSWYQGELEQATEGLPEEMLTLLKLWPLESHFYILFGIRLAANIWKPIVADLVSEIRELQKQSNGRDRRWLLQRLMEQHKHKNGKPNLTKIGKALGLSDNGARKEIERHFPGRINRT